MIKTPGGSRPDRTARAAGVLREAWRSPPLRAWLAASLLGGAAVDALIVYQVPVTDQAGLPLAVAAAVAGFRGLAQLAGRLPLTGLTGGSGPATPWCSRTPSAPPPRCCCSRAARSRRRWC